MGRVKIVLVKKVAERLVADYPGKFTQDFAANKKVVDELVEVRSKKLRNLVAGHVTRLVTLRSAGALEAVEEVEEEASETPSEESAHSPSPL